MKILGDLILTDFSYSITKPGAAAPPTSALFSGDSLQLNRAGSVEDKPQFDYTLADLKHSIYRPTRWEIWLAAKWQKLVAFARKGASWPTRP